MSTRRSWKNTRRQNTESVPQTGDYFCMHVFLNSTGYDRVGCLWNSETGDLLIGSNLNPPCFFSNSLWHSFLFLPKTGPLAGEMHPTWPVGNNNVASPLGWWVILHSSFYIVKCMYIIYNIYIYTYYIIYIYIYMYVCYIIYAQITLYIYILHNIYICILHYIYIHII